MASTLSDELVRELVAAGQVDILVGVPSYNHAATIGGVARAVHLAFARHFPRERTLLLNADGGSSDGTTEVVDAAALEAADSIVASQALRTIQRITAPYHGVPGKGTAVRTIFTAAELLRARAVAIVDPDVTSITPDWIRRLIEPVLREGVDFVSPAYARHALEGPLVTQLVRPLVRALYGHRLREPLAGEFGCSTRFASHAIAAEGWEGDGVGEGVDLWMVLESLARGHRCVEVALGPHTLGAGLPRPSFPELFGQVFEALLACLDQHADYWLSRTGSEDVPWLGGELEAAPAGATMDPTPFAETFRQGVRELGLVHEHALDPALHAELRLAAEQPDGPVVSEDTWARTVLAFVLADHHRRLPRPHLSRALVPLYLGRAASFLKTHADRDPAAIEAGLEALGLAFERGKQELVARWNVDPGR